VQYPSYVFAETLRDGTAVTVRAAGANDGPKIRRAFLNLERDTVYTRFFGYKADVSDAELGRITGADFERAVALLVTIGAGEDEVVRTGDVEPGDAEHGVGLIDIAIGGDAGAGFGDALAVAERGLAGIATAGVDFVELDHGRSGPWDRPGGKRSFAV